MFVIFANFKIRKCYNPLNSFTLRVISRKTFELSMIGEFRSVYMFLFDLFNIKIYLTHSH